MSTYRCSVLAVDDEPAICTLLTQLLSPDFEVFTAHSAEAAREILSRRSIDIVLTDQQLDGMTGVQLLEYVCLHSPATIRIMMTGLGRLDDAVDAINCGRVHHYLFKPWKTEQLLHTMQQAARTFVLERSHEQHLDNARRLNLELEQRVQDRTRELAEANRLLQQRNDMLKRLALTDELTGLPNRRAIERLAKQELMRRARYPSPMALGLVDADHFKQINSEHLLPGGDHALTWLGQTLAKAVRTVDIVGRVGGEEFLFVAPETDHDGATILGERVRRTVAAGATSYNGSSIRLTISIGIAVAPAGTDVNYDSFRTAAASALQDAKSRGRDRCVVSVLPDHATPPDAAGA